VSTRSAASESFDAPSQTLIFVDWDDTLCPTASCKQFLSKVCPCDPSDEERQLLRAHEAEVIELLRCAASLAHVCIVTMAEMDWVHKSIAKLMPDVADVLEDLKIDVVSARESLTQRLRRSAFSDDRDPAQYLKTKAMERILKQFHREGGRVSRTLGTAGSRPWKNIVSFGDSTAERFALQDLVFRRNQRDRDGEWKECRCKTLLLLEDPTLLQLTGEVRLMRSLMSVLVHHDGDIHVDLAQEDLEKPLDLS
jgi:hypothetical protein